MVYLKKISIVILVCLIAVGVLMASGCTDVEKTSNQVKQTANEVNNTVNEINNTTSTVKNTVKNVQQASNI